jgi:two-component system OmpR family response regulator
MDRPLQRILLVEDDAHIRIIAEMSLKMVGGFEVRTCGSGPEALDAALGFKPELVLLDVMMPGMDGPAVLAELRRREETAAVRVIFFTARTQREEIDQLLALGALDVIAKPFDPMKLADAVRAAWARAM